MVAATGVPPKLPGLTYVEPIGTGGFADVYLYQQALPARRVAVKVLREATDGPGLEQFHAEANVMAQLAGHPSIVPIYQADVSADGRAYLVMEFCPPPHLAQRYRSERLPVPEVLELAVKIASAVETAHRVGILHRDIKPHNILTSVYGSPLLTDFGIAAAAGEGEGANYGMSVPWSPPEAFQDPAPLDVRSDVFSLAATVYSLLAGRSPSEVPGATNDSATLIHRIERQDPARILRADVPDSLNTLLLRCLSKRLDERPPSAMAFARSIQEVQIELHLPPTRLEVLDASPEAQASQQQTDDERTRVRPVAIIVPDEIAERGTRLRPRQVTQADDRTVTRRRGSEPTPQTVQRRSSAPVDPGEAVVLETPDAPADTERAPQSRLPLIAGGVLAALVAAAVVAALVFGREAPEPETGPRDPVSDPAEVISAGPVAPTALTTQRVDGRLRISWTNPDAQEGDRFRVRTGKQLQRLDEGRTLTEPRIDLAVAAGQMVCVEVFTVRESTLSQPLQECVTAR